MTLETRPVTPLEQNVSSEIEFIIAEKTPLISDQKLQKSFRACLRDPLHDIHMREEHGKVFTMVETGDIPAMWLRDATVQMLPFLRFVKYYPGIRKMVLGVINQQVAFLRRDPYANAHMLSESTRSPHAGDITDMKPGVFERKWEIDSLSHVIHLSHLYWQATDGDTSFIDDTWTQAMHDIAKTFAREQHLDDQEVDSTPPYTFFRLVGLFNSNELVPIGRRKQTAKIGLIHSTHRPSDDAVYYPFNIPENLFAAHALGQLAELSEVVGDGDFARDCRKLKSDIDTAIEKYGKIPGEERYGYEINGLGDLIDIDDANIPGWVSLLYLCPELRSNLAMKNARAFALSSKNVYFYENKDTKIAGIGSPHTGKNKIWPLSTMLQALTSDNTDEIRLCFFMLKKLATQDGRFNESVSVNNRSAATREDFGMANSMMAELILQVTENHPELLLAA